MLPLDAAEIELLIQGKFVLGLDGRDLVWAVADGCSSRY
jgi:hypothetical protein